LRILNISKIHEYKILLNENSLYLDNQLVLKKIIFNLIINTINLILNISQKAFKKDFDFSNLIQSLMKKKDKFLEKYLEIVVVYVNFALKKPLTHTSITVFFI
jgi:hypothetical protein